MQDLLTVLIQVVAIFSIAIFALDFYSMLLDGWQHAALPPQPPMSEPELTVPRQGDPALSPTVSHEEIVTIPAPALQPMSEMLDLTTLKLYKLHGYSVVRVVDIPIEVPASLKRYKLHKQSVVRLIDLERTLTA